MAEKNNIQSSLGKVLVEYGIITQQQYETAWKESDKNENTFPDKLIKLGYATETQIIKGIGLKHNYPFFEDLEALITDESSKLLPEKISRKRLIAPLFKKDDKLLVAMLNPFDLPTIDIITQYTDLDVQPVITTRKALFAIIAKLYKKTHDDLQTGLYEDEKEVGAGFQSPELQKLTDKIEIESKGKSKFESKYSSFLSDELQSIDMESVQADEAPIIKLVNLIINEAIEGKSTDIHIEPESIKLIIRYRIDGKLKTVLMLPIALAPTITSRLKIMSRLDIAETRLPQDGHIQYKYMERIVDLRLSTLTTITGEKTTIRILDKANLVQNLTALGFSKDIQEEIKKIITIPNGIFLVTGPTGSGKTTTLYTILSLLQDDKRNISTLEDPVEYQIDGINQIQVMPNIGLTFAKSLRSLLRQDPDIIFVGEIRDLETANIAARAAMTGHLILSTLHTNDACSTITRLLNMGIEPYIMTSTLRGIIAQRLIRMLCDKCKKPFTPDNKILNQLELPINNSYTFYRPEGCDKCANTGFKGRTVIFELLVLNETLKDHIMLSSSYYTLVSKAKNEGFKTMLERSADIIIQGITSPEEVFYSTRGLL